MNDFAEFNLNDFLKSEIQIADKEHKDISDSVDVNVVEYRAFGRKLCKKHGISPDFVMQLAFQLAYYKQTKQFESVYESCSTAAFKHGRTETMRPLTSNTKVIINTCIINIICFTSYFFPFNLY